MIDLKAEKSPWADLPYRINMATGHAAAEYASNAIASVVVTDWAGNALSGITVTPTFSGSEVLLRISGGTLNATYQIHVRVTLTDPPYKDEAFLTLYVRRPS